MTTTMPSGLTTICGAHVTSQILNFEMLTKNMNVSVKDLNSRLSIT